MRAARILHILFMWLIVGLGNPGRQYAGNRHNIGFRLADRLAERYQGGPWQSKFKGEITELRGPLPERALLLKPLAYMNKSGESVQPAAQFYKIPPERILVFYDELDLPPGKLRVKQACGSGGHNGIKSLDAHLGPHYWRVRLGIGRPPLLGQVTSYVLGDFTRDEWEQQSVFLDQVAAHMPELLRNEPIRFMNQMALARG